MDEPTEQAPAAAPETPPTPAPAPEPVVTAAVAEATPPPPPATEPAPALSPTEQYQARVKARQTEAPKPAATEVAPVQEPPKEAEVEPAVVPAEPAKEKILPNRITSSQFNQTEQEAIALLREMRHTDKDATLKDAYIIVEQRQEAAKANQPEPTADPVEQIEASLSDLRAKRRELATNGSLYETDLDDINVQIENQIQELAELKAERRIEGKSAARAQSEAINNTFEQSKAKALASYPTLADETSEHSAATRAYIAELRTPGHPNAALLEAVDAPMLIAMLTAPQTPKATQQPAKPAAAPPAAPQPKKIQTASAATPATPQPTQQPANWESMSPDEQYRFRVATKRKSGGVALGIR
ncbi:MAG: hypothetical protein JW394_1004 [Nitrospira sp.]|nr:hypothetical protein [Nitrospira sp.]